MSDTARLQEDAQRIVELAAERGMVLRLLGGLAVRIHSPSARHRSLERRYPDLDFVLADRRSDRVELLLSEMGYVPNQTFNLLNGDRQIDVFVNRFHMCHTIPIIAERLEREPLTVPLAELFLMKMQIVQMNEKDVRDLCALILDHSFGEGDEETFDLAFIVDLCAHDWGLWKTVSVNAQKVRDFADAYELEGGQKLTIAQRLDVLNRALDEAPKNFKWRARDRIGERVQWYDLPEEVQRG